MHGRKPRAQFSQTCPKGHAKTYVAPNGRPYCRICNYAASRKYHEGKRQERLRARRQRLAERARPPKEERVWAAGHFEGEGTFTIASGGRGALPKPRVSLASTDKSVIEFFHARWPGYLRTWIPNSINGRARRVYYWQLIASDAVEGFALDMLPHLQTTRMRTKADLMLEDVRERIELRRTPEVRQRRFERMARMRVLNRRGTDRPRGER